MSTENGNNSNNQGGGNNRGPRLAPMLVALLVVLLIISYFTRALSSATNKEIPYTEFIEMLNNHEVESVFLDADKITINPVVPEETNPYMQKVQITYCTGYVESSEQLADRLIAAGIEVSSDIPDHSSWLISIILTYVLPLAIFFLLISFLSRHMVSSGVLMVV